jgi:predicted CoA-binding protein
MEHSDPRAVLEAAHTVAVVGCSRRPAKAAHRIPAWLQDLGYRVIPVNPHAAGQMILGEHAYARLEELPEAPDLVVVFRPSEECAGVVREAIGAGARAVWLQLDIVSPEAHALAHAAGVDYVEDRCSGVDADTFGIDKNAA